MTDIHRKIRDRELNCEEKEQRRERSGMRFNQGREDTGEYVKTGTEKTMFFELFEISHKLKLPLRLN